MQKRRRFYDAQSRGFGMGGYSLTPAAEAHTNEMLSTIPYPAVVSIAGPHGDAVDTT